MREFPASSFLHFFQNHGLLNLKDRPQWRTVVGGSRVYVETLRASFADRLYLQTPVTSVRREDDHVWINERDQFDAVVIAAHANQALAILRDPSNDEQQLLSNFRYQENRAVLHSDASLMPKHQRVWSAWNYLTEKTVDDEPRVSVTYWMNCLQNIHTKQQFFVTLNPLHEPKGILRDIVYHHPVYDDKALEAQSQLYSLQGQRNTWFCGSYFGYGFHEDGLKSGINAARGLGVELPWRAN